jgi:biotin transport system substrate-specific component
MEKKKGFTALDMAYVALGAALIAVCAFISIPAAVPFTLQTFGIFCVLTLLGGRRGTLSIVVYILLGLIGVPVFAGFKGGPGVLLGTTGGYILGFLLSGAVYWAMEKLRDNRGLLELGSMLLGLILCYAFGTAWFMNVYAKNSGPIGLATALSWCVFPFVLPDLAKLALGFLLGKRLKKILKL